MLEFHISRRAREKYKLDDTLFSYDGNVIFANFRAARAFAHKVNSQRDLISFPEQAAKASQINAMGLIDEIFHHVFHLYREQKSPTALKDISVYLERTIGKEQLDHLLETFIFEYPPALVFAQNLDPVQYLSKSIAGIPNHESALEELVMLWLSLQNPALDQYSEFFEAKNLTDDPKFQQVMKAIQSYFMDQPKFGPANQPLIEMLMTPAIEIPHSITGQLEYIREHWSSLLGDYLYRLLLSLDLIKEENKLSFTGPGPVPIPVYDQAELLRRDSTGYEAEAFSKDREWMPRLVLIAKNSYVWLDQLSRKYQTSITRLDQIPDAELETLSRRGITGLWLIGLWERSPASAQIKKLCGNPNAISSAYSLYSYQIAADLGGEAAYESLRDAAACYGIRLASDMVPNHMGIDSEWMIHNPDRFLSLDQCPYPSYSFTGQDLSSDPSVTIQIEDHYYDRTDAAVVFRRRDNNNGQEKYVYHGNDGTSMPWNDTAQLNYMNPEVRETVIQTILEVARKFPIIRFDAAMTLAKKHYQRLWFPQPGTGGAIPSRSEHSLPQEEFERAMPVEFWREVVDRAAVEAPDTLLLAEAFWMMEGYFVRTLGMHRVYNSAFMNMLRNEDNIGYRKLIKNTLEFEPEILKRYVNFMNNPDERTAVDQFGKGDKYFGTCLLMATLPGLPMLGHGQIEGFSEKYGMEFRQASLDEQIDADLVARHEREIFPLLHQRRLFAEVENFNLFDFFISDGNTNENVYAYTNRAGDKSALVIYNNNYNETEGWIQYSTGKSHKTGSEKKLERTALDSALNLKSNRGAYLTFRDQVSGLCYLRPLDVIHDRGFHIRLRGFEYHAFLDFEVVTPDAAHDYSRLYAFIGEQGVPNIEQSLTELVLSQILDPFKAIFNYGYLHYLYEKYAAGIVVDSIDHTEIQAKVSDFLDGIGTQLSLPAEKKDIQSRVCERIFSILQLTGLQNRLHLPDSGRTNEFFTFLTAPLRDSETRWITLLFWALTSQVGMLTGMENAEETAIAWVEEWKLTKCLRDVLLQAQCEETEIQNLLLGSKIGITQQNWFSLYKPGSFPKVLQTWISEPETRYLLKVNRYDDILWYSHESFAEWTWWMMIIPMLQKIEDRKVDASRLAEAALYLSDFLAALKKLDKSSGYQVEKLISLAGKVKL